LLNLIILDPSDNRPILNTSVVSIVEGDSVSLLCVIKGGNPKANITWDCFGGKSSDVSTDIDSRSISTVIGNRNQDGQLCICYGQHDLVNITPAQTAFNIGSKYMKLSICYWFSEMRIPL